mmetsp:Transcript_10894/g.19242  ORF Transcript_10894/g.19242 Transcript_10894/m.19242 type:complete len:375 (+) Transcript_10894:390-1514(+)
MDPIRIENELELAAKQSGESSSSDDGYIEEAQEAGFEGPEKILEVDFVDKSTDGLGMRGLTRGQWDSILDLARCQILSLTSNDHMDAYVLSESSLFVFKTKVFIKTCGTTTLLRCLPLLLEEASAQGMELEWIGYSRKNFVFPEVQVFPHNSFSSEIEYTRKCSGPHGHPLAGGAYILGDLQGDHWYIYSADYSTAQTEERSVNIMMYGLDPAVAKQFYRNNSLELREDAKRVTDETGIRDLCENAVIDDWMFDPCGYSMNGLDEGTYYTIHVTPEEAFSYASFETNLPCADYTELIQKVLRVFRPERFTITLFGDEAALQKIVTCPTHVNLNRASIRNYFRENQSTTTFRDEYACRMAVYKAQPLGDAPEDAK